MRICPQTPWIIKFFEKSSIFLNKKKVNKYWKDYLKGKSKYIDAKDASNLRNINKKM